MQSPSLGKKEGGGEGRGALGKGQIKESEDHEGKEIHVQMQNSEMRGGREEIT